MPAVHTLRNLIDVQNVFGNFPWVSLDVLLSALGATGQRVEIKFSKVG